jgi:transcription initiation factor TFIIB
MNGDIGFDIDDLDDLAVDDYFEGIDFNKSSIKEVNTLHKKNLEETICNNCKSTDIIEDNIFGSIVCSNCGQILDMMIDHNPEWRQYDEDGKNDGGRCGQPVNKLLPNSSLGTRFIGCARGTLQKLHIWNSMPYRERSLNNVFKVIAEKCETAGIKKNIQDDAKIMYKTANDCKHDTGKNVGKFIITRGKNRRGIIAACVFFACRKNKCTRNPKEIAEMFSLKHTELSKGCKNLFELLRLRRFNLNLGTSRADQFVMRYCNNCVPKIKTEYGNQAVKIASNIERLNIASEHTPFSIAATSVLIMAEINGIKTMTRKLLAKRFMVSEVTIGKVHKKIEKYKHILCDDDAVNKLLEYIKIERDEIKISDSVLQRMKQFGLMFNSDDIITEDVDNKPTADIINLMSMCGIDDYTQFLDLETKLEKRCKMNLES